MPIYKPSNLRPFLKEIGAFPKKALSQNFVIDGNIITKILDKANIVEGDIVLEIGPGPGALTEALLNRKAYVIAVEMDKVFAEHLNRFQTSDERLEVVCLDFLDFPTREKLLSQLKEGKKAKVVANLPYHITSPILERLVGMDDIFSSLTLMVQEEVAKRFVASPKCKDYSSFSIFLQLHADISYAFQVPRGCFYPEPSVLSAVVHLELHPLRSIRDQDAFFKMTRKAFEQRRKMLKVSLKTLYASDHVTHELEALNLSPLARPEELSPEDFIRLFDSLNPK